MMMKSFSLAVLTAMTLAALAAPALAAEFPGGGSGTEDDPYIVSTRADLEAMHDDHTLPGGKWTAGKYFLLEKDIDLDSKKAPWSPISFYGHFDGGGGTRSPGCGWRTPSSLGWGASGSSRGWRAMIP